MNEFLDGMARVQEARAKGGTTRRARAAQDSATVLLLQRDRAILELLYASGLRVSELTGLNMDDVDRKERMLRVLGKGNKERIIPYGSKAEEALKRYWPIRAKLLARVRRGADARAVFLSHEGRRMGNRSVARVVKKFVPLMNINGGWTPQSLQPSYSSH